MSRDLFNGIFRGKRVLITGHTGFKGAWLSLWLRELGAEVTGYSLDPPTEPSLFGSLGLAAKIVHRTGDVTDGTALAGIVAEQRPEFIFHLAAQSLVRVSYREPAATFATNVTGTVNLLEAVRRAKAPAIVINVTSDKCYENREREGYAYREQDPLGGHDPYSASKACAELVTQAYRRSFFSDAGSPALATVRAGNVIGGGDWAADRLVPDCLRAFLKGEKVVLRSPRAVRPWQHVLDPLHGYLLLAARLHRDGPAFARAWNFGPDAGDARPVEWLVGRLCASWGAGAGFIADRGVHPHEAGLLMLDCTRARTELGWRPRWGIERAIDAVVEWTKAYRDGADVEGVCLAQLDEFCGAGGR